MKKELRSGPSTKLRTGFTTGACAAAAAKGAAVMLAGQTIADEVTINLPAGGSATFSLHGQSFSIGEAGCFVIKDAGDDPDVTNGAEVHAKVTANPPPPPFVEGGSDIIISGGIGIGKVTKPGLAIPPGEWAINPVPRKMIEESVRSAFSASASASASASTSLNVTISIPDGEQRAKKTLNQRLGIIGGLSILGTTGIVRPISAKAWTDTIDAALDVARACGCETVVLSTGRTSELAVQKLFNVQSSEFKVEPRTSNIEPRTVNFTLPEEAFIMMGDHVAYALQACAKRGFTQPVIACQFAKLLKIACGYENTHAAASELDLGNLCRWSEAEKLPPELISLIRQANTAREIAVASGFDRDLIEVVVHRAEGAAVRHSALAGTRYIVCDYNGNVVRPGL